MWNSCVRLIFFAVFEKNTNVNCLNCVRWKKLDSDSERFYNLKAPNEIISFVLQEAHLLAELANDQYNFINKEFAIDQ